MNRVVVISGVWIEGSGAGVFSYNTIANNKYSDSADSLYCSGGAYGQIRNNIIVGSGDTVNCPYVDVHHNAIATVNININNRYIGSYQESWFEDPENGDFHLAEPEESAFSEMSLRDANDPSGDIDGDALPSVGHVGVDES